MVLLYVSLIYRELKLYYKETPGAEEMSLWLKVLITLSEDPRFGTKLVTTFDSRSRESLLASMGNRCTWYTDMHASKMPIHLTK